MATLMDALLLEVKAAKSYDSPVELLDMVTGKSEPWMPIEFKELSTEQKPWPDGWARPWMARTLAEALDDAGMLDDEMVGVVML
jgi:hypothetical protein